MPDAGASPGVSDPLRSVADMRIDCETCEVRGPACADCVVTFLTIPVRPRALPAAAQLLDEAEQAAVAVLAAGGLIPPLRMVAGG